MPTVTRLARSSETRTSIDLDGAPWRTVPSSVVGDIGLSVGTEVSRELARELRRAMRRREALEHAERLLASSERSVSGLERALALRGVARIERDRLVADLGRAGLLSDSRTATRRAAALAERGWGNSAIEQRLATEGYAPEACCAALAELDSELERARAALARKPRTAQQAARFLSQRGFDPELYESLFDHHDFLEG